SALACELFFFFQAEDGIRDWSVTGVQTCALPICIEAAAGMPTNGHTARSAAMTPPPVHRHNTPVNLAGRVAIVTGGAVGIGRVYVRRLLAEGARVLIGDIVDATDALRELADRGEVRSVTVDVASATSAQAMTDEAVRVFGRLDIL